MAKIKESELKKIFKEAGLSDGIFDLFNKKRNRLKQKIKDIEKEIEGVIDSAPTKKEKQQLRNISNAFRNASKVGVFDN